MATRIPHRRLARAFIAAALACSLLTSMVAAQSTVSFQIRATGPLRAFLFVDRPFGSITFSHAVQHDSALIGLVVSDQRGTAAGWSVVLSSSDFVYRGTSARGRDLPNQGFTLVSAGAPELTAGEARGDGGPNVDVLAGAGLNAPRGTMWAAPGWGSGDYRQPIALALRIPARSQPGPYLAILTVALVVGP